MKPQKILGVLGAIIAYPFIAASIVLSPWFDFTNNALSDLGNAALHGSTAWIFNSGLIIAGVMTACFAILISVQHRSLKYLGWSIPSAAAGVDLALVGVFSENTGSIHFVVSVILFSLMAVIMLTYSYCSWPLGSPKVGAISLAFGIAIPVIWFIGWPWHGVAIQETLSCLMTSAWILMVSMYNV
ncbi:MAG TPA: DUF998 domain-containing protein [Thermoproteota archaeon]|nr:DUF998 domain-containing protein [Thermoproteota archaeon]